MSWLLPLADDDPASMLRWVRRIEILMIPLGAALALLIRAEGLVVSLVAGETVLAIVFAVALPVCLVLGLWLADRWLDRI